MTGLEITLHGQAAHTVEVARHGTRATVTIDSRDYSASLRPAGDGRELTLETRSERMWVAGDGDTSGGEAVGQAREL